MSKPIDTRKPSKEMILKLNELNGFRPKLVRVLEVIATTVANKYIADEAITTFEAKKLIEKLVNNEMKQFDDIITEAYAKRLSVSNIIDLIDFYRSEAGVKIVENHDEIQEELRVLIEKFGVEFVYSSKNAFKNEIDNK